MNRLAHRLLLMLAGLTAMPLTLAGQQPDHRYPLTADSAWSLGLGFQERVRVEGWSNFAFNAAGANDEAFALLRAFGHAELRRGSERVLFVQLKSALSTGRDLPGGDRATDVDQFDVQQAYARAWASVGTWKVALSAGRFELAFGKERLVSPLDWVNTRRSFQGGELVVSGRRGTVRAIYTAPVIVEREHWNSWEMGSRRLFGVYVSGGRGALGVDSYWLGSEGTASYNSGPVADDDRHTFGARAFTRGPARAGAFDADVEAAWQIDAGGLVDVSAFMVGAQAGWRPTAASRLYLGFDYGSGDDSTSGSLGTFNQLYPLSHAYLGYADVHGRQNIVDLSVGVATAAVGTSLMFDVHNFWRASTKDGLYGVDGTQARAAGTGLASRVGTEVDLTARRTLGRALTLQAGWSVYVPGDYLKQSGPGETLMFGYGQVAYTW